MEILLPNAAIRNLIREGKLHMIYGQMQLAQEKSGMQTFNQSLSELYFSKQISREMAFSVTSFPEELTDIIQRREARPATSSGHSGAKR
jgi:twitching motility protein PilT